ncbi:Molybdenum transport system permease protein ModB [Microbacterium oleivorans]|uniref:ABC transporter permease n=1 Tax=Microbacterium oleivorans TaxID=273677 RepID=UPI0009F89CD8|nr:iron ABC transporter permease [Microbacterium oleivorans]AZS44395.1 Molybdenum transport system permease protein ModB [Microbacterium oleivorans]
MSTTLDLPAAATPLASPPPGRGRRQGRRDPGVIILGTLVVAILALLVAFPVARLIGAAFSPDGLATLGRIATDPVNHRIIGNTMLLGVIVGAVGTVIGFLFAYAQVRVKFRGKRALHLLAMTPIVAPPFAVATAVITLFGRNGAISFGLFGVQGNVYGLPGLVMVLALSFFPVAYMNFKGMLESLDPSLDEAAAGLGAGKLRIFFSVTLPLLVPGFAGSFLLLFVEAIADLANPLVLGGDYTVLASRAYLAVTGEFNTSAGAAYSLTILLPALLVFLVQRYWVSRKSVATVTGKPAGRSEEISAASIRVPVLTIVGALSILILTIYATVLIGGFLQVPGVNNTFTLEHFRYVLTGLGSQAMSDTALMALVAAPVAGVLGMLIAWLVVRKLRRFAAVLDFIGMMGLAVPGTVLGIGYALAYISPTNVFGIQLLPALAGGTAALGGAIAIVMVYVARSLPSGQRAGIAALNQIDPAIEEASTSLGAASATTFRTVTLPLIQSALITGLTFAFARSMTTLSPIVFLTTPEIKVMTSQILAEVDAGRFGNAFAYCTVLIMIVLILITVINLLVRKVIFRGRTHRR